MCSDESLRRAKRRPRFAAGSHAPRRTALLIRSLRSASKAARYFYAQMCFNVVVRRLVCGTAQRQQLGRRQRQIGSNPCQRRVSGLRGPVVGSLLLVRQRPFNERTSVPRRANAECGPVVASLFVAAQRRLSELHAVEARRDMGPERAIFRSARDTGTPGDAIDVGKSDVGRRRKASA